MDQVSEWLASPYSATEGGLGCTSCHDAQCRGRPGFGRVDGASSGTRIESLRAAASLTVNLVCAGSVVSAEVAVTNVGVGHHLPTGPAARLLVLEVAARGPRGVPLRLGTRPRLAGGLPASGGKVFALGSHSAATPPRHSPLAPFATDVSTYRFTAPDGEPAEVTARLVLVSIDGDFVEIAGATASCPDPGVAPRSSQRQQTEETEKEDV